jgi:hypothetical protein
LFLLHRLAIAATIGPVCHTFAIGFLPTGALHWGPLIGSFSQFE